MRYPVLVFSLSGALLITGSGCTSNSDTEGVGGPSQTGSIAVESTDDACNVAAESAPSGNVVFDVTNGGSQVTEFYLLADDGLRIVGEIENVGPGISRNLVVAAEPGSYFTACKPGMVGDGIRSSFTVTDSGQPAVRGEVDELLTAATDQYRLYVRDQVGQLVTKTEAFADLYARGKDDEARALYADARTHWERIEPVAESFGDLDPRLDLREADLEVGQTWTGWHRMEKDLWPPDAAYVALTPAERGPLAEQLVADTNDLADRVETLAYTPPQLGNGAKELLDEVATGKVTGEEEIWSHTDLWDFQANVDGARVAFEALQPALLIKNPTLAETLTTRFDALQKLLDSHRSGSGFVLYTELTASDVKVLADAVNALGEPLSELTAAVVL
jgi:iron uptake system component EfeO